MVTVPFSSARFPAFSDSSPENPGSSGSLFRRNPKSSRQPYYAVEESASSLRCATFPDRRPPFAWRRRRLADPFSPCASGPFRPVAHWRFSRTCSARSCFHRAPDRRRPRPLNPREEFFCRQRSRSSLLVVTHSKPCDFTQFQRLVKLRISLLLRAHPDASVSRRFWGSRSQPGSLDVTTRRRPPVRRRHFPPSTSRWRPAPGASLLFKVATRLPVRRRSTRPGICS
jgi:hypothetical protein